MRVKPSVVGPQWRQNIFLRVSKDFREVHHTVSAVFVDGTYQLVFGPLIHAKRSVTLLLQLGRKSHVNAPTHDEV